jgi:NAD(P)-dependent dehydrogenase (short-subunit alcohol dehydrogenase family)
VSEPLLLDEMHAPVIAQALRERGHDVIAVADQADLRALSDEELFGWAGQVSRRIVTENVKDFRPLVRRAEESGQYPTPLLFTSSRTFPRSRRNPGPLIDALAAWLDVAGPKQPAEDWLIPPP